jgi:hypothetical protein
VNALNVENMSVTGQHDITDNNPSDKIKYYKEQERSREQLS